MILKIIKGTVVRIPTLNITTYEINNMYLNNFNLNMRVVKGISEVTIGLKQCLNSHLISLCLTCILQPYKVLYKNPHIKSCKRIT